MLAKEDHIYRLNHVINTLFRFNLHAIDTVKLRTAIELANYLFDVAGLDQVRLPRPDSSNHKQPDLYVLLMNLLNSTRPPKSKPVCHNCNTKPASRRKLCVACYRYQLKHGEPRPLRLIIASRHSCRVSPPSPQPPSSVSSPASLLLRNQTHVKAHKSCANCGIQHTHQWYRNLCGSGHWCETCKSYYLRHNRVRPPQLFVKAAKRKVNVRALVDWSSSALPSPSTGSEKLSPELVSSPIHSPASSSGQATPVQTHLQYATTTVAATAASTSSFSSSSSNNIVVYYHQLHNPHFLIASSSKDIEPRS
ncbi:hypothetical protein BDB00DRAFT_766832 [Zychaea mexicana]|uniref:uncharacterized protein n=1 Tax=Zychaea mexicana TaxID=64656 RepID=UPI0022FDB2EF|nr:uncharacterized protein BDB00DRAFT_766832 [Zychaea mexicana]KAI9491624.1 hypothetical protein BDB00DRAFT_766832 [Zychaea mexicana]